MPQPNEQEIAERAFENWERIGKPTGGNDVFWQQAELELSNADGSHPLQMPEPLT
jgi:hypothetical protein